VGMKLVNDYTSTKINAEIDESLFGKEEKAKTETMQDSPEYSAEQIIGFLDKDGDEKISKEEAKASPELSPAFAFVDTSKDGFIDMKEAEAMVEYMKKEKQANQPATGGKKTTAKEIIASMDKNKDGKISKCQIRFGEISQHVPAASVLHSHRAQPKQRLQNQLPFP